MTLIKCTECGHMISDKATKCPKCGCPTTKGTEPHIHQETPQGQPFYYENKKGGRFRKWLFCIIALLVAIGAGGGYWWYRQTRDERDVKQFVEKFVKAVELGDKQTILHLYPDAESVDSMYIPNTEFKISKINESNNYKVEWAKNVWMEIMPKNEKYMVNSSQGIFAWSIDVIEFAKKTGQWKADLSDKKLSARLKDKEFYKSIVNEFCSNFKKKVIQKGSLRVLKPAEFELDDWNLGITIANTTDVVISGSDYKVTMKVWDQNLYNNSLNEKRCFFSITINGKDIASNGETLMSHSLKGTQMVKDNSVRIQWLIDDQKLFNKYFVAKGDEYEKYLESKN